MSTSSYYTKTIRHYGNELAILMQNENGPCPLLAIANVLILRGGIYIHPDIAEISFGDLTARMAEYMLDQSATLSETDEVLRANQQRNIADGMALFPKLQLQANLVRLTKQDTTPKAVVLNDATL